MKKGWKKEKQKKEEKREAKRIAKLQKKYPITWMFQAYDGTSLEEI